MLRASAGGRRADEIVLSRSDLLVQHPGHSRAAGRARCQMPDFDPRGRPDPMQRKLDPVRWSAPRHLLGAGAGQEGAPLRA